MIMMVMMCFLLPPPFLVSLSWCVAFQEHLEWPCPTSHWPACTTPPSLGSQRPLDFLYSITPPQKGSGTGAGATLGVVVVVDGYGDDDEEENGQGENVME